MVFDLRDHKIDRLQKAEYARLRARGWAASEALRAARINGAFAALERAGKVKLEIVEDPETYDASYIDTWTDVSAHDRAKARKEIECRVQDQGTVGIRVYAVKSCGEMHEIDAVWGFIGDDWRDSGYDVDLKRAAIDAVAG